MKKSIIYSIAVVLLLASASYGCPIFSDNFNAEDIGIDQPLDNWNVVAGTGTIDVIGTDMDGDTFDYFANPKLGCYLDLDGSFSTASGRIETIMLFEAGTYMLTFDLAGSQKHRSPRDTVDIYFGSESPFTFPMSNFDGWTTFTINTTITGPDPICLAFDDRGIDHFGVLLDNVNVYVVNTADVPEPSVISLFILGLASFIGFRFKQKK